MKNFGEKIKARRKALKLTQKDVGSRVGVSHVTISQWEDNTNFPKTENFLNLSHVLNFRVEELLSEMPTKVVDDELLVGLVRASSPNLSPETRRALVNAILDAEMPQGQPEESE